LECDLGDQDCTKPKQDKTQKGYTLKD